ncbi:MAG: isoprenylcysteine carboxylmethyltransferase family protein [Sinimarinibacterium sp.]|jgi:protein-S-isoprenylcysteine O-methyltransferase Ste14
MNVTVAGVSPRRRIRVTRLLCVSLVTLVLVSRPAWHDLGALAVHLVTPLGILLASIGALGRLWCSSYAAGNKNAVLMTAGPYSLARHPLYVFSLIGGLGIAITTETVSIPLIFIAWFAYYYRGVIAGEERQLRAAYGALFEDYAARVPRFWPGTSGWTEPARWEIAPANFRRSLAEVVWFVVAALLLHELHDARDAVALPSLFALY